MQHCGMLWMSLLVTMGLCGMLGAASAEFVDRASDKLAPHHHHRVKRSSECESKYSDYRSTHTLCLTDDADATEVSLSEDMKNTILDIHNDYRRNVAPAATDMRLMVWDDRLARTARKWAMQCPTAHDDINDRGEPDWPILQVGQNIGLGHSSFESMLERFWTEHDRYNYTYGLGYVSGTGHYLQLVSALTTRVGCGEASCPSTTYKRFRVCNYAPVMDTSQDPYTNGTSCGDCAGHCDSSGKLCDCGNKLCLNSADLDVSDCGCVCQSTTIGSTQYSPNVGDNCQDVNCVGVDPILPCRNGVYTVDNCGSGGPTDFCPQLCGLCDEPCPGQICYDGLEMNTTSCECVCLGTMNGDVCETSDTSTSSTQPTATDSTSSTETSDTSTSSTQPTATDSTSSTEECQNCDGAAPARLHLCPYALLLALCLALLPATASLFFGLG